jgi:hypothetical protein
MIKTSEFNTNLIPTISNSTANAFFKVAAGNLCVSFAPIGAIKKLTKLTQINA